MCIYEIKKIYYFSYLFMWFFSPYLQKNIHFDFEQFLREVDENEERSHDKFIKTLPQEEQGNFQTNVCKYWLRNLCDKGDHCKFLHEFDRDKMIKCQFYEKFHKCSNPYCIFQHDKTDWHDDTCLYYARGFCRHGNRCRRRHDYKNSICLNYLAGFCPDGQNCIFGHPKWVDEESQALLRKKIDQSKDANDINEEHD